MAEVAQQSHLVGEIWLIEGLETTSWEVRTSCHLDKCWIKIQIEKCPVPHVTLVTHKHDSLLQFSLKRPSTSLTNNSTSTLWTEYFVVCNIVYDYKCRIGFDVLVLLISDCLW